MNFEELEKAYSLSKEIKEIDFHLRKLKNCHGSTKIIINDYVMVFDKDYKEFFVDGIKLIRDALNLKLNELGVTEVLEND